MRKPLHKDGSWLFWHKGFGFLWTPKLIGVGLFGRTFNYRRNHG